MKQTILFTLFIFLFIKGNSQNTIDTLSHKDKALNVYIDCDYCDMSYLKTEITVVNYVRDHNLAQVHVIVTSLQTGSGGTEFTFVFIGEKEFSGKADTLKFVSKPNAMEESYRIGIAKVMKLGLIPYIAKTPYADKLIINFEKDSTISVIPETDKWHSWVFNLNANGSMNGQQLTKFVSVSGGFNASKVTDKWKINLDANTSYNNNFYVVPGETIESTSKSQSYSALFVRSLSNHFSAGLNMNASTSTFTNTKLSERFSPGIEYSVFPYSQSTHKQFRILYLVYGENVTYYDTTIYDKIKELQFGESLTANIVFKQEWGSLSTSLIGSHYFYDFSKNNLSFNANINLNLFQGLTLSIYAFASLIHNQLYLPKAGASTEEILLTLKSLQTSYSYYTSIGLSYTFGSIYNNIVNPRFTGN